MLKGSKLIFDKEVVTIIPHLCPHEASSKPGNPKTVCLHIQCQVIVFSLIRNICLKCIGSLGHNAKGI